MLHILKEDKLRRCYATLSYTLFPDESVLWKILGRNKIVQHEN